MISAESLSDDDVAYPVSCRPARHAIPLGAPPQGRFETTSRQKLFASARRKRGSGGQPPGGIHLRGNRSVVRILNR